MRECFVFEAIRGVQAGRDYFAAMCPLRQIPRLFLFAEEELPAELRAQRSLSAARVPLIARYIMDNPTEYVFSSLTASVDGEITFEPLGDDPKGNAGLLSIPMRSRIVINDGQHRRAAIEEALKHVPHLGDETISVVFYQDINFERCQQMFADLNRHAAKPTKSLSILYDHRDPLAKLVRQLIVEVPIFEDLTELEKTSISNRSHNLFTLNSIYQATQVLLRKTGKEPLKEDSLREARDYWTELGVTLPELSQVQSGQLRAHTLRKESVLAHGVTLQALGRAGSDLLKLYPDEWKKQLRGLLGINWSRSNSQLWEGRALVNGRITKGQRNVVLIANVLNRALGIPLNPDDERVENRYIGTLAQEEMS